MRRAVLFLPLLIAACGGEPGSVPAPGNESGNAVDAAPSDLEAPPSDTGDTNDPVDPPAAEIDAPPPPTPTPDETDETDKPAGSGDPAPTPESEAGPQGAARVAQRYFTLLGNGNPRRAYALWEPGRAGMTAAQFARSFEKYGSYRATVGTPSPVEGAAGSRYTRIPVRVQGTLKQGNRPFALRGTVTLRRVADVPGSSAAQRRWRIYASDLDARPGEASPTPTPQPTEDNRSVAHYRCADGARLTARFDPDNGRVTLLRDRERIGTLQQRRAASGIWYVGRGWELRGKGREVTLTQDGKPPLSCTARVP
ncbi:MliC family protein [Sphingomonas sp. ST-64]|uniref:MliC family protein n=1 Tax=Sphingomonas plantiphila TaxID=3163295 RepID=A0ABW8YI19_9SPHN